MAGDSVAAIEAKPMVGARMIAPLAAASVDCRVGETNAVRGAVEAIGVVGTAATVGLSRRELKLSAATAGSGSM